MLVFHSYNVKLNRKVEEFIYENLQEFQEAQENLGIRLSTPEECVKGDYIKSDNGYYLPVKAVDYYEHKYTDHKRITMPRMQRLNIHTYKRTGAVRRYQFVFRRDNPLPSRKFIPGKHKFFINLVLAGYDFDEAFTKVFGKKRWNNKEQLLTQLSESPHFYAYIKENYVDIKKKAEQAGLDAEWYSKQLMDILSDKKSPSNLRIKAMESIHNIMTLPDKEAGNSISNDNSYIDQIAKRSGLQLAKVSEDNN